MTAEAFELVEDFQRDAKCIETESVDEKKAGLLNRVAPLCVLPQDEEVQEEVWLELLASLHYLRHVAYRPAGSSRDFDDTFNTMCESKPQFNGLKNQAELAWNRLDEFGLITARNFTS